ncbi:UPF0489 family protein [Candidatus Peregrinibacteria bacterium]|nr:UPF0489 family protein [Candidatus Peregrinibacteria bacterium]
MYKSEFQITDNISNNSFSFSKRKTPTITVPKIIDGEIDDVKIGDKIVFEDFDEHGDLKSCVGLKNFIRTTHPITKKPIIIVDNHNHVFYFWYEARKNKQVKDGGLLVHIDQHKDVRKPDSYLLKPESEDLKKVFEFTNTILNVGNYIPSAMDEGLIGDLISITSETEIANHKSQTLPTGRQVKNHKSLIVNIDLDFWAPEMDYINNKLKTEFTKKWMEAADIITIATSPFFIDQNLAIKVLKELLLY